MTWLRLRLRDPACAWLLVWLAWVGFQLSRHEMWRDEMLPWAMAVSSPTWSAWLQNIHYDPHPKLWHLLLFLTSRLTGDLRAVQGLHVLIAAASCWLVLRRAPFAWVDRVLLIFGYFFVYEYAVISRNYALGVLGLCAYCATDRRKDLVPWLLLSFMALTSLHALIVACALGLGRVLQRGWCGGRGPGLLALAALAGLWQIRPPPDSLQAASFGLHVSADRCARVLGVVWEGLVPVPLARETFWNSNVLDGATKLRALLGAAGLGLAALGLRRRRPLLVAWLAGAAVLLAFSYSVYLGYVRHFGFLFLLLVAVTWLVEDGLGSRARCWAFRGLLVVHVGAGLAAAAQDLRLPFSASADAASFLRERSLQALPLLGHGSHATAAVAQRLRRPMHFADSGRPGWFVVDNVAVPTESDDVVVNRALQALRQGGSTDVVVVLNYPWGRPAADAIPLAAFTSSVVRSERYYLYRAAGAKSE